MVRSAYAKLVYGAHLDGLRKQLRDYRKRYLDVRKADVGEFDQALRKRELEITLRDFQVGDVPHIMNDPWSARVEPYGGKVLQFGTGTSTLPSGHVSHYAIPNPNWHEASPTLDNWNAPVKDLLAALPNTLEEEYANQYTRYAAYTVTVSYAGVSRTYKAMFLFGANELGWDTMRPADNVLGSHILSSVSKEEFDLYPYELLEVASKQRHSQSLILHALTDSHFTSCQAGTVCCDLEALKCGVSTRGIALEPDDQSSTLRKSPTAFAHDL
jgi:hypothetical protein